MSSEPKSSVASGPDDFRSSTGLKATPLLWVAIFLYATAFVLFAAPIVIFFLAVNETINPYYAYVF
jgi:hypothetical protein